MASGTYLPQRENHALKTVVINEINPEPNSMAFRRDSGVYTDYYLVIIAYQPYTVTIEELTR
jgi:hypothetical protein